MGAQEARASRDQHRLPRDLHTTTSQATPRMLSRMLPDYDPPGPDEIGGRGSRAFRGPVLITLRSVCDRLAEPRKGGDALAMTKTTLITGITGQDGSYLAELLLSKGYEVHGIVRRASTFNSERLDDIYQDPHTAHRRLFLHYGDLSDAVGLVNLVRDVSPNEVYHLGAQSHVKVSFEIPEYTAEGIPTGPFG